MVGAEGTRAGKNFHTVASSRFNLAQRGKEMEGRARAQLQPCAGRSGGGEGFRAVHGGQQKEGWGSARWQTCGRNGGGVRSVRQGTGAHGPVGFGLMGRLGEKGTDEAQEEYDPFYLSKLFLKSLDLNQLKDELPLL
jgi:hypothetical protein